MFFVAQIYFFRYKTIFLSIILILTIAQTQVIGHSLMTI